MSVVDPVASISMFFAAFLDATSPTGDDLRGHPCPRLITRQVAP